MNVTNNHEQIHILKYNTVDVNTVNQDGLEKRYMVSRRITKGTFVSLVDLLPLYLDSF